MSQESYSALSHLALNVVPPSTEWLNMGYWEDAHTFPEACRALAVQLHEAARIPAQAKILDVGHGCGDSLLLLLEREPCVLHGVTSMPLHAYRAQQRVGNRATVWCADAVEWLASSASSSTTYDVILALDCAYHFTDRSTFFRNAYKRLAPGGTLALVDLVGAWPYPSNDTKALFQRSSLPPPSHAPSVWSTLKQRVTCYLSGTNPTAFISFADYEELLRKEKFLCITMQDISHSVFPGFGSFLQNIGGEGEKAWRGGGMWQWKALRAFGHVVNSWAQGGDSGMVRCGLIVARKQD